MSGLPDTLALVGTTIADKYAVESVVGEGGFDGAFAARFDPGMAHAKGRENTRERMDQNRAHRQGIGDTA